MPQPSVLLDASEYAEVCQHSMRVAGAAKWLLVYCYFILLASRNYRVLFRTAFYFASRRESEMLVFAQMIRKLVKLDRKSYAQQVAT